MRIAILGWGSLLWDHDGHFDEMHEPWEFDGPMLKIEFSRVSKSRCGALTLVIDEKHGTQTQVSWCLSRRQTCQDTVCDLRAREGTTLEHVAYACLGPEGTPVQVSVPRAQDAITQWAGRKNLDTVVWTALPSNFQKETEQEFSVKAAVAYVKTLCPAGKAKAAEYVWRAPAFVRTPLRAALQQEPWFA